MERWNTPNVEIDRISIAIYSAWWSQASYGQLYLEYFRSYFLLLLFLWVLKNKNSLRTIEAEIS